MASNENLRQPLLDRGGARDTSVGKYTALPMSPISRTEKKTKKKKKEKTNRHVNEKSGSLQEKLSARKQLQQRL